MEGLSAPSSTVAEPAPSESVSVVVVMRRLYENGGVRSTLRLVQQWTARQVAVDLVALQRTDGYSAAPLPPGVRPVHPSPPGVRMRYVLGHGIRETVRRARRADVVVSGQHHGYGLMVARVSAWLARRPFVVIIRSAPGLAIDRWVSPRMRSATRWTFRTADRVVCISPGLVPSVLELGVRRDRISVALNGVEVERIAATRAAGPADLPAGEGPLVVGIGRLEGQKGFDVLIRAHAEVTAAGHPHRLLLLGEGPDRAALERLATDLGVTDTVHLPGFTTDPLPVLAAADLYCMSSRYEGFGQSLAEALILGVPTVATDCVAGPRLLLADGKHGDLVPVDDVAALTAAIQAHLEDPQRLRAAAALGQTWATEHLSIRRAADELLEVLHDVTTHARRATSRA